MKRTLFARQLRQLPAYRRALEKKRAEVLSSLGIKFDTMASMGRLAEEDQAQVSHDEFIALQINSLDYRQLVLIEAALRRLGTGEYGTCQACEGPISIKRLEAIPWASHCIRCESELSAEGQEVLETVDAA